MRFASATVISADLVVAWDAPNDASLSVAKDGAARCVALGFLVVTGGDYDGTVMAGTNYGRDNDSIAGMGAAIAGDLADLTRKLQSGSSRRRRRRGVMRLLRWVGEAGSRYFPANRIAVDRTTAS